MAQALFNFPGCSVQRVAFRVGRQQIHETNVVKTQLVILTIARCQQGQIICLDIGVSAVLREFKGSTDQRTNIVIDESLAQVEQEMQTLDAESISVAKDLLC